MKENQERDHLKQWHKFETTSGRCGDLIAFNSRPVDWCCLL